MAVRNVAAARSPHAASTRIVIVLALLLSAPAIGDGGSVQLRQAAGPLLVTVFTAPTPLRAGPADVSVLVQTRDGNEPVLDADVLIALEMPHRDGAAIRVAATRQQATNKLLYVAPITLPAAGSWDLRITVRRGQQVADVAAALVVAAPLPRLLAYWPYLAFPPVAVLVFALHQWLRSRSSKAS